MTRRFRRILFYTMIVFFFLIAGSAIFYSNGWRFDLETFTVSKLGGIYFERIPDGSTLSIEKTDMRFNPSFFNSSVLIANLFPKTYTARATKDGFQTWLKQISVQPSLVTEIDPILMLPEKTASTTRIAGNIRNFWAGPKYLITQNSAGSLIFKTTRLSGADVMAWSGDGQAVITSGNGRYFLISLNNPDSAISLNPAFSNSLKTAGIRDSSHAKTYAFQPDDASSLIVQTENGLYLFDAGQLTAMPIASEPVYSFAAYGNEVIFSTEKSIYSYDSESKASQLLDIADPIVKPAEIQFNDSGTYFTLRDSGGKFELVRRQDLKSQILARNAKTSLFAPGAMKLAFTATNSNELTIYTFGRKSQALDRPETGTLNLPGKNDLTLSWHKNASYLFMEYPDALYLLEANSNPPINLQKIDDSVQKYFYDSKNNMIYLQKNNALSIMALDQ